MVLAHLSASALAEEYSRLKFSGLLYFENYSYLQKFPGATIDSRNELTFRPRVDFCPSEQFDSSASVEFRKDISDPSNSNYFYFYEAYLRFFFPSWSLTIGRQFIPWGRVDTLRPTNVFTRRDYTDLVGNKESGILALKSDIETGIGTLEMVWSPIFEGDMLQLSEQSRWFLLPRSLDAPGNGLSAAHYEFESQAEPAGTIEASQLGLRLTGDINGWDYGAMYAWTFDRTPTFFENKSISPNLADQSVSIALAPHYLRRHVFGVDFATVLSRVGLRGEAAYVLTKDVEGTDSKIDDPYLQVVSGLDCAWDVFGRLLIIVQYALDLEVPGREEANQESPEGLIRFRHFYRQAALLNAELRITEFLKPAIKSMINVEKGDFLIQPEVYWLPLDGMAVTVGADILGGSEGTFFGDFKKNSRVRVRFEGRF